MNAIFLLDKPIGISSNLALQKVKRLFHAKKAGHTGSLDPLATGMLPICFGEATKFSQHLLDADKTYSVTMQLGVRTTTSDSEGEIVSTRDVPDFSVEQIDRAFDFFRGTTQQVPSMFSALKHNGRPLYEYARQGITIDRPSRPITIYELTVSIVGHQVDFTVRCSKGTYVRSLVDDVGEKLGCGAHVTRLRRLAVAPFLETQMMTMDKLTELMQQPDFSAETVLLPMDAALNTLPRLLLSVEQVKAVMQGKSIIVVVPEEKMGLMRLIDSRSDAFLGVGELMPDGVLQPKRLIKAML
jgi:tRNA pseudouridine55 synthase